MASLTTTLFLLLALQAAQSCRYFCKNQQTNTYQCCDSGTSLGPTTTFNPGNDGSNPEGNGSNPEEDGSNTEGDGSNPGNDGSNPGNDGSNPKGDGSNTGDGSNPRGEGSNPEGNGSDTDGDGSNPEDDGSETDVDSEGEIHKVIVTEHGPEDGAKYNKSSGCVYYCAYGGSVYCCDDGSLTMPGDHDPHGGRCPTEHEQVCKDDAIFLNLKGKKTGRTLSGTSELSEVGDTSVMCASDGYCASDEKCCTSVCHKRHVCLKALHSDKKKQKQDEN